MSRAPLVLALALAFLAALPAAGLAAARDADRNAAERALTRIKDLKHGIGVRTGRELTPALADLAARRGALDSAGRKQADALLARPTDGNSDPQNDGYTVTEETPTCSTHFCVHYVATTADAPSLTDTTPANGVPDYVEQMAAVFENEVFPCENGIAALGCADAASTGLGWPQAPSDGTSGGNAKFDVYLKQLGDQGIFGYVAPDPGQSGSSRFSYLVMDNNFSQAEFGYADTMLPLRVTAAHEYNHVLQFGIDTFEDTWMFESTATWMEEKVYPAINDYVNYLDAWVNLTAQPITAAPSDVQNTTVREDLKIYGSAVWNHFVAGRHGNDTILDSWQASVQVNGGPFAPASYSAGIAANGGTSFETEFDDFSAAIAEWRAPGSGFPDLFPDVPATERPTMTVGAAGTTISLDHTTFAFRNIPVPASASNLTLEATLPAGLKGAIALVARTGNSTTAGTVTKQIQRLTNGGAATVTLPNADTYGRITAVLVNADPAQSGFNNGQGDWNFTKDGQNFTGVRVTSTVPPPPAPPTATTAPATNVTADGATLNGSVNPNGKATTWYFEYGPADTRIPAVAESAGSGTGAVPVAAAVAGVGAGVTVVYRLVAESADGTSTGVDRSFKTLDPPAVTTGAAGAVTTTSAVVTGTVDPRGKAATFRFEYGTTTVYGQEVGGSVAAANGPASVASAVSGLPPGAVIHYRLSATTADGTTTGDDATFTTASQSATGATTTAETSPTGSASGDGTSTTAPLPLSLVANVVRAKLAAVLRKGLRVRVTCGARCSLVVKLVIRPKLAKRLRVKSTLATARATGSPAATVRLKLSKKTRRALGRIRSLRAKVVVSAISADGRKASVSKPVTLRR